LNIFASVNFVLFSWKKMVYQGWYFFFITLSFMRIFWVLVFNYLNISIRGWSSKIKIRVNIYHYLSWLITLDLLNTCIRTFGLWKNCQILFESWNIIMFLYPPSYLKGLSKRYMVLNLVEGMKRMSLKLKLFRVLRIK